MMLHDQSALMRVCCLTLSLLSLAGCGGDGKKLATAPAKGKITFDGKPLAHATITLYDESNKNNPSAATTDEDGNFKLSIGGTDGALPGKYKVTIQHFVDKDGKDIPVAEGMDPMQMEMQGQAKSDMPPTYADYPQSVLTAEVKEGTNNTLDFALKADGSKP